MTFSYPAFIEVYGGEYLVRFHDFPEIFASGSDEGEAIFNATESLAESLMGYIDAGQRIPYPTANIEGAIFIAPNAVVQSILQMCFGSGSVAHKAKRLRTSFIRTKCREARCT